MRRHLRRCADEVGDPAVEQRAARLETQAVPVIVDQIEPDLQIDAVEDRFADVDANVRRRRPRRRAGRRRKLRERLRSEEHTSELQSLMRISYAVFCLKKKKKETKV